MKWFREHSSEFSGPLLFDEPLSKHTYYRIGGPASALAYPTSLDDLRWLSRGLAQSQVPYFITGAGSNLLAADEGFKGLVIKTQKLDPTLEITSHGDRTRIRTGASVAISSLLRRAVQEGWGGLEFLAGIPGSVGGVVFMNAGTHLGEAKDRLRSVDVFSFHHLQSPLYNYSGDALKFEYRRNLFLPPGALILAAEWEVSLQDPAAVKTLIDDTLQRRKATQPIDFPSCGSVFKNPRESGKSAWQVIDELGLRGHQIGHAQFSKKHSNFIINLGGAKAADVLALIELAKKRAMDELGIELHQEVISLGNLGS